jgi:hypothetical protein
MRVDEINERSVLLARQSSALTFLLNKIKTQNAALATVRARLKVSTFNPALRIAKPLAQI